MLGLIYFKAGLDTSFWHIVTNKQNINTAVDALLSIAFSKATNFKYKQELMQLSQNQFFTIHVYVKALYKAVYR